MPHLSDSYVVKGVVARDSVVGIIGSSGSGKTFFAADLAAHIARGVPWRGQKVRAGLVVYVALEGLRSAENRFIAIREAVKPGNVALVLTGGPLNLRDPASVDALLTLVRSLESEFSTTCMAVFVDTLSRALAGGDENHSEDMASLVAGADTLRMATGAAIVLVHHLGKDAGRGARGHSLLNAALDTELTVSAQGGVHVATVTKQRDYAVGAGYAFKLEQVGVGLDEDGELVTTCLLKPESEVPPPAFTGKHQVAFDAALREWQREHTGEEFISDGEIGRLMLAQGLTRQRRADVLAKFTELHRLYPCEGGFRFR
jgi:hypothetical protein